MFSVFIFIIVNYLYVFKLTNNEYHGHSNRKVCMSHNMMTSINDCLMSCTYHFMMLVILVPVFRIPSGGYAVMCCVYAVIYLLFHNRKWYSRFLPYTIIQFCTKKEI